MGFGFYQLAVLFSVVFLLAMIPIFVIALLVFLVNKKAHRSDSAVDDA